MRRKRAGFLMVLAFAALGASADDFEIVFTPNGPVRRSKGSPTPDAPAVELIVNSALADLRREPKPVDPALARRRPYDIDPLQETQLLHGEIVRGYEERDGWIRVEAGEQAEFTHHGRWQGYPGWVRKDDLAAVPLDNTLNAIARRPYIFVCATKAWRSARSKLPLGSRLHVIYRDRRWSRVAAPSGHTAYVRNVDLLMDREIPRGGDEIRRLILDTARLYLGQPYYWGGRAGHRPAERDRPSGVDCSGLVNLAYRVAGFVAPRDSHEQFMVSKPLATADALLPGDVVFLAKKETPDKIVHVMLYEGGENLIEAVHEFDTVRRVSFRRKLGRARADWKHGAPAGDKIVYFGRLLP